MRGNPHKADDQSRGDRAGDRTRLFVETPLRILELHSIIVGWGDGPRAARTRTRGVVDRRCVSGIKASCRVVLLLMRLKGAGGGHENCAMRRGVAIRRGLI